MPSVKSILAASAFAFLTSSNAHMILLTPPPYGSPDSSPLDASGSNFPCKATSNSGGTVTNMNIGSSYQLSFKGSAVHGGGSCQVSLTTDNPATTNSKWSVIHSIEGGCPARNAAGNEGDNAQQTDSDKYNYTIPQGISPGAYTLAWTWFNKIGNREMYMNCASVKIAGGSSKRDIALNETDEYNVSELSDGSLSQRATPTFPDMFKANIPTSDCETQDSMDLQFPDPGQSVEKDGSGQLAPPKGPNCAASGSSTGGTQAAAASGSSGSSAAPSAAAAGSSSGAASSAPSAAASGSGSTGGSGAAPDSQSASAGGGAAAAPSLAAPATGAAAPSAAANSSGSSSSASGSSGSSSGTSTADSSTGTCSQPGQSICSPDGKQIGTCTASNTVTWIPVADGTQCSGGIMVMAGSKRSAKFAPVYNFPKL